MTPDKSLQLEQTLRMLGFTRQEVKVLLYLFRVKKASVKRISREALVPFNLVQAILANLSRKDLVILSGGEEDTYEACKKEKFFEWIEEEKHKHDTLYEKAEKDMSNFFDVTEEEQWQPEVFFFEGEEGIKEIYEDMLKTGEDLYSWTDLAKIYSTFGDDYTKEFITKRIEKGIRTYAIKPENEYEKEDAHDKERNRQVKLTKDLKIDAEVRIYGNKIAFITFQEDHPIGICVEGETFAKMLRTIFKNHWDNLS